MNMFLKKFNTAAEAVKYLREEGILTGNYIDCEKIAAHYAEVISDNNLQKNILTSRDRAFLKGIPAEKKQEKIQGIKSRGLIPWRQALMYLPRYPFLMKEFEEAVKQSA